MSFPLFRRNQLFNSYNQFYVTRVISFFFQYLDCLLRGDLERLGLGERDFRGLGLGDLLRAREFLVGVRDRVCFET